MITIAATTIARNLKQLGLLRKRISDTADGQYRQKILYLIEAAATVSPQFSGDFASNWFIATSDLPVYQQWPGKHGVDREGKVLPLDAVHKAGDSEAIDFVMTRAKFAMQGITIKTKVYLINATDLTTDGTSMTGPDGTVQLRPENVIPGRQRIESYVRAIAKDLS